MSWRRFYSCQIKSLRKTSLLYSSPELMEKIRQMEDDYQTAIRQFYCRPPPSPPSLQRAAAAKPTSGLQSAAAVQPTPGLQSSAAAEQPTPGLHLSPRVPSVLHLSPKGPVGAAFVSKGPVGAASASEGSPGS
ncbi:hypothetical protein AMECASPLE_025821, partial [Ameca splendens]